LPGRHDRQGVVLFDCDGEGVEFLLADQRRGLAQGIPERCFERVPFQRALGRLEQLLERFRHGDLALVQERLQALEVLGELGVRHAGSESEECGGVRPGQRLERGLSVLHVVERAQRVRDSGLLGRVLLQW